MSEKVKLKILGLLDRLLNRAVMRKGDVAFTYLVKWIKVLEETVSPYKSPKAMHIIENLSKRAKVMITEPLLPLSEDQVPNYFENWDDYKYWLRFYEIDSIEETRRYE